MIRSMTGYGEASAQLSGSHYYVEVRSLNNKYFKATIRLPDEFQGLEAEMESRLRHRMVRGTITVNARCADASENAAYDINTKALSRYIEQLRTLPEIAGGHVKLDVSTLLGLPGVLQPPSNEEARFEAARAAFLGLLDKACDELVKMREREGQGLVKDLEDQRAFIAQRLGLIAERAPGVVTDYEVRLKTRIESMLREAEMTVQPCELIREIAIYAERTDIAEEVKRLQGHLDQFGELMSATDSRPIGRTLDFLAQEMLRETNTIASKSPDAAIARCAVDVKGAIDRIKEQAQNVE
jgi:uncharacterized protein (TIGR00255 family)